MKSSLRNKKEWSQRASAGMAASENWRRQRQRGGEMFERGNNGEYADEYSVMLNWRYVCHQQDLK